MKTLALSVLLLLVSTQALAETANPQSGLGIRLGALVPLKDAYAGVDLGVTADASYWHEFSNFAIEPRIGFAASAVSSGDRRFYEVPFDFGGYYVLSLHNVAIYAGGGAGIRYLNEYRREKVVVGNLIRTEHLSEYEDKGFAFGAFGRMGAILFRSSSVRMVTSIAYNVTLKTINERKNPQAITAGVGLYF